MAMTLVSTITLANSSTTQMSFTSIPQSGKDLVLLVSARSTTSANNVTLGLLINSISSFTYNQIRLRGDGSNVETSADVGSNRISHSQMNADSSTSSVFGSTQFYVSNYANSGTKLLGIESVTENNATAAQALIIAGSLPNAGAVTRLDVIDVSGGAFVTGTTASLYIVS